MAELVLTDQERAAVLWTELDDAALGAMLRKKLVLLTTSADQMDRTISYAAALLLCSYAAEMNAEELRMDIDGVTQSGREFGDWQVVAKLKTSNE